VRERVERLPSAGVVTVSDSLEHSNEIFLENYAIAITFGNCCNDSSTIYHHLDFRLLLNVKDWLPENTFRLPALVAERRKNVVSGGFFTEH